MKRPFALFPTGARAAFALSALLLLAALGSSLYAALGTPSPAARSTALCALTGAVCVLVILLVFFIVRRREANDLQKNAAQRCALLRNGVLFQLLLNIPLLLLAAVAGIRCSALLYPVHRTLLFVLPAAVTLLALLALPVNLLLNSRYVKRLNSKRVGELQQMFLTQRARADRTAAKIRRTLQLIRLLTSFYALLLALCAACIMFCAGALYPLLPPPVFAPVAAGLSMCAFSRIRFLSARNNLSDVAYVTPAEFPQLYAMVQKAADTMHCAGTVKVALIADCNAGIAKTGNIYCVQLGVLLLELLSQAELQTILYHEFSHMTGADSLSNIEGRYHSWLLQGGSSMSLPALAAKLFCFPDMLYSFRYLLYRFATSVWAETAADRAMAQYGDRRAAASALLKIKYNELFCWECAEPYGANLYAGAALKRDYLHRYIDAYHSTAAQRETVWNHLAQNEIISRNASHPTLKMRLQTLGVTEFCTVNYPSPDAYRAERRKALDYTEDLIYQGRLASYEQTRTQEYLKPKRMVTEWEAAGEPLLPETYADIHDSLWLLGEYDRAEQLCDRAIRELSQTASCHAYYLKGCALLRRYDASGIDALYRAIETNSNYIEDCLSVIGDYCCLTGQQDKLDEYRRRSGVYLQQRKDVYSAAEVLSKHDVFSHEQLPEGLLEQILTYLLSLNSDCFARIYLMRKTLTSDFFTSVFIIEFVDGTTQELHDDMMHRIFMYLDTCSDWQFSLYDFEDTRKAKVKCIEGSCVYEKKA